MKRICSILTIIIALILLTFPVFAAPVVSIGNYIVNPGDTFTIDIILSNTQDAVDLDTPLDTFSFRLNISPSDGGLTIANPVNWATGPAIPASTSFWFSGSRTNDYEASALYSVFASTVPPLSDGVLASLDLSCLANGSWDLILSDIAFGHGQTKVTVDTINGSVSTVPIPATALLFLSGILGLVGVRRKLFR